MPNWCDNDVVFYSTDKAQLYDLLLEFKDALSIEPNHSAAWGSRWLGHILMYINNLTYDEIEDLYNHHDVNYRGGLYQSKEDLGINSISSLVKDGVVLYYFYIGYETAWGPSENLLNQFILNYPDVYYKYTAEEPGCNIYINTDTECLFFDVGYKLSIYNEKESSEIIDDYYTDFYAVVNTINNCLQRARTGSIEFLNGLESINTDIVYSVDELLKWIDRFNECYSNYISITLNVFTEE